MFDIIMMIEKDFENFVWEFFIDDSILECFVFIDLFEDVLNEVIEFVVDLFEINFQGCQSKFKKKYRINYEEIIFSDEDLKLSDFKWLKFIFNLFGKKNKNKEGYKVFKQSDIYE